MFSIDICTLDIFYTRVLSSILKSYISKKVWHLCRVLYKAQTKCVLLCFRRRILPLPISKLSVSIFIRYIICDIFNIERITLYIGLTVNSVVVWSIVKSISKQLSIDNISNMVYSFPQASPFVIGLLQLVSGLWGREGSQIFVDGLWEVIQSLRVNINRVRGKNYLLSGSVLTQFAFLMDMLDGRGGRNLYFIFRKEMEHVWNARNYQTFFRGIFS